MDSIRNPAESSSGERKTWELRGRDMNDKNHIIAIVGMAGRFPGARNVAEFWKNLRDGVESVRGFSDEEILSAGVDPTLLGNPNYVKCGTFFEDAEYLDAAFFGVTPREAEIMDPQHRVFLECAWEALEDAGCDPGRFPGSIGVYAGVSMNTYIFSSLMKNPELLASMGTYQVMLANDKDFLPTRVSYKFNLRGPSLSIQTACSTSLVAVQVACQSLLARQCDMALAGGVSLTFPQKAGYLYQEGMILSPDGHCRPFDAKAAGIFSGAGAGIVVLKRMSDALADGDFIHALILGAAINNDGALKVGYTAPGVDGQAEAIAMAQAMAGVEPETIRYVEAHGTGTVLGDPIEVAALTKVFRTRTQKRQFCAIGSVKSNIGHLDAAAGVAGLIKTVLALRNRELPPSLNFQSPNPEIDFDNSPFYVNTLLSDWASDGVPRRAAVSSFGIGGTNAHVIVEEAPDPEPSSPSRREQLLVLSARTATALDAATHNLTSYLTAHPEACFADVVYTLQTGRKVFNHRRVTLCRDREEAILALETADPKRTITAVQESLSRPVVFMFSGQGSQYPDMAAQLYNNEPMFRKEVDECADFLKPQLGIDLRDLLYPSGVRKKQEGEAEAATPLLDQTRYTQPALFVIEYALARLWMSWGIQPEAMIGHSIGEYAAACLAGVFSREDALMLVAVRGRLMQEMPGGAMLAVFLPEKEAERFLNPQIALAAVNSPSFCTISGPQVDIQELETKLTISGIECRRLHTSHAFHSWMMDPLLDKYAETIRRIKLNPPRLPFASNLTGTWIQASEATDPYYWSHHLRNTVRFASGLQEILREPSRLLLEVGPGRTLVTFAKQLSDRASGLEVYASLPHAQEQTTDDAFLHTTLGRLWLSGVKIDWTRVHNGERRHRVPIPTYPFERKRFCADPAPAAPERPANEPILGKKKDIADWFYIPVWKQVELSRLAARNREPAPCSLVFLDQCGLGENIIQEFDKRGHRFVAVQAGDHFSRETDNRYTIRPDERQHYDQLLQHLLASDYLPNQVWHLWSVTAEMRGDRNLASIAEVQRHGFYSLLFLAQAIGELQLQNPLEMAIVSNHLQNVNGDEEVCPEKATLLGPCKVIPQEYPWIRCRSLDIVLPPSESAAEMEFINRMLAEFPFDEPSSITAYRGRHRWSQTYQPFRLAEPAEANPLLREKGVYLITGGLGGIGLVFAEYLAGAVKARLVLTARTAFPPRAEWDDWLQEHPTDNDVSRRILKLRGLEALGSEVMVVQADVANPGQMQAMLELVRLRFGEIDGAIHAAGLLGGETIQMKSREMADRILRPKVEGTLLLERLLRGTELDFLVLCSSTSAILGGFGSVDYCAANTFLDAFACSCAGKGNRRTISVNWDAWQEVGMAANVAVPAEMRRARESTLRSGILPLEGVGAFRRILGNPLPQVVVSTRDLLLVSETVSRLVAAQWDQPDSLPGMFPEQGQEASIPLADLPPRYMGLSPGDAQNEEEKGLAQIWRELLGIDTLSIHDDFFELGGHSLLATRILARIQDVFRVRLPLRTFFENPTVAGLAKHIQTLVWLQQGKGSVSAAKPMEREEIEL